MNRLLHSGLSRRGRGARPGFSLIELLVVISIIGVLMTIGLPALRGFGKGNAMNAAVRQLLDDLALARLRAINERTTVYMVFLPPAQRLEDYLKGRTDPRMRQQATNLFGGQRSSYALASPRTVGDQPGQWHPRYLTDWRRLPEGVVIAPYKFVRTGQPRDVGPYLNPFEYCNVTNVLVPFPSSDADLATAVPLPCLAFLSTGQLVSGMDEIVTLVPGSVFVTRQGDRLSADVAMRSDVTQADPRIRINWATGRAAVEPLQMP